MKASLCFQVIGLLFLIQVAQTNKCGRKGYALPDDFDKNFYPPDTVICPDGYTPVFDQCYKILNGNYTPNGARDACSVANGTVAEIKGDLTNGAIYQLTMSMDVKLAIIGVMCGENCSELTTYGGSTQTFTAWEDCEPSHQWLEKCVVTNFKDNQERRARWNNVRCGEHPKGNRYLAVCQMKTACPRVVFQKEGITFEETKGGKIARSIETCNGALSNSMPKATRLCKQYSNLTSFWEPWDRVQFTDCTDPILSMSDIAQIEGTDVTVDNVLDTSRELRNLAMRNGTLLPSLEEVFQGITNIKNTSLEITNNVVTAIDHLMTVLDDNSEVKMQTMSSSSSNQQFVQYLEQQITNLQRNGEEFNISTKNLQIQAVHHAADDFEERFDLEVPMAAANKKNDSVTITFPTLLLENTEVTDDDFDSSSVALTTTEYLSPVLFENQESTSFENRYATNILGVTLEGRKVENLGWTEAIILTFPINPDDMNTSESSSTRFRQRMVYTCSFWDFQLHDGLGGWSTDGCFTVKVTSDSVQCNCNHLTNLCVLVHESQSRVLDFISKIGCFFSAVGLTITVVFFILIKKMRTKAPQKILLNLCIALLGFYLAFFYGIERKEMSNKIIEGFLCIGSAALIQYLALVSMAWMSVEALHMYLLFVKVTKASVPNFVWKAGVFAWGMPIIPVAVSLSIWRENYTAETYCFLDWNEPLMFGFLPFLLLMFSFNALCYVLILQRLICSKQMGSSKSSWNIAWQRVLNSVAIATLLGMSWGFGFISLAFVGDGSGESLNLFDILFCLALSLKGFFVFLLFGVRNKEFREPWRRIYLRVFRKGKQSAQINFPISVNYSDEKATNFMGHTVVPSQRTFSTAATSLDKV
ncbi:Adhesion G-protein coupled receptor G4 [Holothuria leucospilota]|uniref:Adhesion G-protein coupled receptor G4 n=1 Tax=Holothuria leucospilota TaxID=206669 RepID=A0A9Q1CMM5_HOLLE|nr:Adhesion G-protein coupled receptor G4 [Holothuria leucospilota]